MNYTKENERNIVKEALLTGCKLSAHAIADWDGMIEIGRCVAINPEGDVERIDADDDERCWHGAPFWSVCLHQSVGGVACIADFRTGGDASAFAAGLIVHREHLMDSTSNDWLTPNES